MKRTLKGISLILAALTLLSFAAGCGTADGTEKSSKESFGTQTDTSDNENNTQKENETEKGGRSHWIRIITPG